MSNPFILESLDRIAALEATLAPGEQSAPLHNTVRSVLRCWHDECSPGAAEAGPLFEQLSSLHGWPEEPGFIE